MKQNNEIRFDCTTEFKQGVLKLKKELANDLKVTAFFRNIFGLGLSQIKKNIQTGMEVNLIWKKK